jgi:hypothetical protein
MMGRIEFLGKRPVPSPYGIWTMEDVRVIVWGHNEKLYVERTIPSTNVRAVWSMVTPNNLNVCPEPPPGNYPNLQKYPGTEFIGGLLLDTNIPVLAPVGTFDKILTKIYGYVAHEDNLLMM